MKSRLLSFGALLLSFHAFGQLEESKLRQHIRILSADSMQGRSAGSLGESMAATYIEKQFRKIKLKPLGDEKTYLQSFPFKEGVHGSGTEGTAHNLVGYLDNHAINTVIIGAHYDHLGLGEKRKFTRR